MLFPMAAWRRDTVACGMTAKVPEVPEVAGSGSAESRPSSSLASRSMTRFATSGGKTKWRASGQSSAADMGAFGCVVPSGFAFMAGGEHRAVLARRQEAGSLAGSRAGFTISGRRVARAHDLDVGVRRAVGVRPLEAAHAVTGVEIAAIDRFDRVASRHPVGR